MRSESEVNVQKSKAVEEIQENGTSTSSTHNENPPAEAAASPQEPLKAGDSAPDLTIDPNASSPPPLNLEQLVNQGMQFLATAPPEMLGGVLVGITAASYLVFGRLALFIAGTLVGVIVHSSWETQRRQIDQYENGFAWKEKDKGTENGLEAIAKFDIHSLPEDTARAIDELTTAVITEYVRSWYTPLIPSDNNFPDSCKDVLSDTLLKIYSHLSQKRAQDAFITFLISTSNIFIVFFRELSTALGNTGLGSTSGASIATYAEDYPSSALAQLLDQDLQKRKYKHAADDILQSFVKRKVIECSPVRTFLHEILAQMLLPMTVDKFSEADWINEWIIYFLDEVVPESTPTIKLGDMTQEEERELQRLGGNGVSEEEQEKKKKQEARKSRAEEDLQQAMKEAEELTRMIEEEERRKKSGEVIREDPMSQSISSLKSNGDEVPLVSRTPQRSRANSQAPSISSPGGQGSLKKSFTSFDQIISPSQPQSPPLDHRDCLHNAFVTIVDLSPPSNQPNSTSAHRPLGSKPMSEYMLQIEPHSSYGIHGWIVTRKYPDFEALHELLIKLSVISGIEQFSMYHSDIPSWKSFSKEQLRQNLQLYINDALRERQLAQCEGMKRFLEKEGAGDNVGSATPGGTALANLTKGWANPKSFKKVGDNVLGALVKTPQGAAQAAQGGKAFFEGVFGGVGGMRKSQSMGAKRVHNEEPRILPMGVYNPPKAAGEKGSVEVVPDGWIVAEESGRNGTPQAKEEAKTSRDSYLGNGSEFDDWIPRAQPAPTEFTNDMNGRGRQSTDGGPNKGLFSAWRASSPWRAQTRRPSMSMSADRISEMKNGKTEYVPPPPIDGQDDFLDFSPAAFKRPPLPPRPATIASMSSFDNENERETPLETANVIEQGDAEMADNTPQENLPDWEPPSPQPSPQLTEVPVIESPSSPANQVLESTTPRRTASPTSAPLSVSETQLIVEILFAILGELFTLSSAWLLRRSLLNVAKNILLRPGNTSLDATRLLIQETLIEANTSDKAISTHLRKLRKGVFPTPEEKTAWEEKKRTKRMEWIKNKGLGATSEEITVDKIEVEYEEEERERKREKARRLLLEKGMPEALKGVMGQQACRECLGKVFDCLQVKSVARGVVGGVILEVVRGICQ